MTDISTRDMAQQALSKSESARCAADAALEESHKNALAMVGVNEKLAGINSLVQEIKTDLKSRQEREMAAIGAAAEAAMGRRTKVLVATIAAVGTIAAAGLGIFLPSKSSAQQLASQDNAIRLAVDKVRENEREERRKFAEEVATSVLKKRDEQIDTYVVQGSSTASRSMVSK